ncbi:glucan exo-1,3-beta-glucosidase [Dipsacomyces acuminosporus]|nr:glucan exo-1,3-beta-glucosidase [Dipsacomyces acuminosporus]
MKYIHRLGTAFLALFTASVDAAPAQQSAQVLKRFGKGGDTIRGVNLGGQFVLEPWIRPSLFKQWEGPNPQWNDLNIPGWQNVILDTHTYHVFVKDRITMSRDAHLKATCQDGANVRNFNSHLWTVTGEWSLAVSDCARWLNGFGRGARWDGSMSWELNGPVFAGATCSDQNSMCSWDGEKRQFLRKFAEAQMDAYEQGSGWIFWNFKTEEADDWNYIKLALNGVIPNPATNRQYPKVC